MMEGRVSKSADVYAFGAAGACCAPPPPCGCTALPLFCTALHCTADVLPLCAMLPSHCTYKHTLVTLTPLPVPLCACVRRNNTLGVRVLRIAAQCSAAFVYRVDP